MHTEPLGQRLAQLVAARQRVAELQPPWRGELDAIMGARHGGRLETMLPALRELDRRYPNIAEINYQLAWTHDILERAAEAIPFYEKAIALGLPTNELSGALLGLGNCLRRAATGEPAAQATADSGTRAEAQATRAVPSKEQCEALLARSAEVLRSACAQFPDNRELDAFLALTLHAQGKHGEALRTAIELLCDISAQAAIESELDEDCTDTGICAYQRTLRHAARAL